MAAPDAMARAFLAALPGDVTPPDEAALTPALAALHAAGRAAWPDLAVDPLAFARHLASLATPAAPLPREPFAADLYLACACALGDARAAAAFERAYAAAITRAVARVTRANALDEDAARLVLAKLLVPTAEGPPKIAAYAGRAPLGGWVNTVAVRAALNLRRDARTDAARPLEEAALEAVDDPELALLEARFKPELEAAIRAALARLTPRERTLLRLHLEQRLTVDALAAHYGVPRATAGRWLKSARDTLAAHAHADLRARLGLSPSEIASVARLVQSRLEVSVLRLLAAPDSP